MADQTSTAPAEWPFGDLTPGTYTMYSIGDGDGDAVITDDGRLLVRQHEGCWHDLTDIYRPGVSSWEFTKREPVYSPELAELRTRVAELEPPRVIETVDDLLALQPGSVVLHTPCGTDRDPGCVWVSQYMSGSWAAPGDVYEYDAYDVISHCDDTEQLLVLWEPKVAGDE